MFRASTFGRTKEPLPKGIVRKERDSTITLTSIHVNGIGSLAKGRQHTNTFAVTAKHETLPGAAGVKFNTETVPKALEEDLNKTNLNKDEIFGRMKEEAAAFYSTGNGFMLSKPGDIRLEVVSKSPNTTVYAGGSGFLAACIISFAQHLPLALGPDHVWAVISYAFAKHVDMHAEELRSNFVQHEGKKRLEVDADHMVMSGGDPNLGSSPEEWEETIFPSFSRQIKKHIGEKVHGAIAADFSTTTGTSRAAHEITLMAAMKNYFSYGMRTCCGIPRVTLHGSEEDWVALRARAEDLGKLMTPEVAKKWMPLLLPVLDEFIESYRGNVNHGFWQSMVKLRDTGGGSGSYSFISGWLQILFPYLKGGKFNRHLRPWQEMYFDGPEPDDFPAIVSSVPVDWEYYGVSHDLHFHAGITGCTQDGIDGTMTPLIGWFVSHDPPQEPDARLRAVTMEIEALLIGHAEEAQSGSFDKTAPWYRRVRTLHLERLSLEGPAHRVALKRRLDEWEPKDKYNEEYNNIVSELYYSKEPKKARNQPTTKEMMKAFYEGGEKKLH